MAQFFISRPIFAWVIAIVIMLAGALSIKTLPLEQYPDIAPPRVTIGAQYTGASAETVENSVTQILEQQIKGIDNMLYMNSTSNASGQSRITLTFAPGTNIDVAQVQVQNKIQGAVNRLPDSVKSRGVFINKGGQDFLVTYSFYSADPDMDEVDIGDYINSNLVDVIGRIEGVGDINVFGTFYAMRIWMDPAKMEKYRLMPSDLVAALNNQNAQVSAGQLGALPAVKNQQLNATITARTKLKTPEEFEAVVLKTATDGAVVTIKDVARVELAADNLSIQAKLNGMRGAGMGIILADGANAMAVSDAVAAKLAELKPYFPNKIDYFVSSDSTPFVRASIHEVAVALAEAMALVDHLFGPLPGQARRAMDYEHIPTAVFTHPPIGTVGLTEAQARARHGAIRVYRSDFRPLKHTLSGRGERTLVKLIVDDASDRVVGLHMVGADAGEIVQGFAVALKCGATKAQFDATLGIHPTSAEEFVTLREVSRN